MVNLSDLLFTKTRDYLIKYNDNQKVKAEQLAGKVIVLHFVSLADLDNCWRKQTEELVDLYHLMQPKGDFEVVFVAVGDAIASCGEELSIDSTLQERFEERFSTMAWTAIPFSDLKSRKRLERIFYINGVDYSPYSFVIDATGVLLCDAIPLFDRYGVAAYPFTKERIEFLETEDSEVRMQLSMKSLFASPERDFLITNIGDQVPVQNIEDKVVGLLFYDGQLGGLLCLVEKLKTTYEQLAENKENFEVVLIYVNGSLIPENPNDEELFWNVFKTMPWLALPFKDPNRKKLMRIFDYPLLLDEVEPVLSLVIVGPHGKFIEPYAHDIVVDYGTPAYPFTRSSLVNLIAENAKRAKLERFFAPDAILRWKNGSQVRFSQLISKRIIVLFQSLAGYFDKCSSKLRMKYIQMKSTDDEFEVVHICHEDASSRLVAASIPWLMHRTFDKGSDADKLLHSVFRCGGLIAFDVDGSVVRRTVWP